MARLIALCFLLLPLLEIAVFILVGRTIGVVPTLALVILAALGGALVLRQQGLGVIARMRSSVAGGALPGREMFDAMLIGLAALLLVLPGFLSDVAALLLLVPPVRQWIFRSLARRVRVVDPTTTYRRAPDPHDPRLDRPDVIDLGDDHWRDGRS